MLDDNSTVKSQKNLLKCVGLKRDGALMLLAPLKYDVIEGNSTIKDIDRIKNMTGYLLHVQYTDDINVLLPYLFKALRYADNSDNLCLVNLTHRKNQTENYSGLFNMFSNYWYTVKKVDTEGRKVIRQYYLQGKLDDVDTPAEYKQMKRDMPDIYGSEWYQTYYNLVEDMNSKKTDPVSVGKRVIFKVINTNFNDFLARLGLVDDMEELGYALTAKGKRLIKLDDYQIDLFLKAHFPFYFKGELLWSSVIKGIINTIRMMAESNSVNFDNVGLAVAMTLCNYDYYIQAVTYRHTNYALVLDPRLYLSVILAMFECLVNRKVSITPSSSLKRLLGELHNVNFMIDDVSKIK